MCPRLVGKKTRKRRGEAGQGWIGRLNWRCKGGAVARHPIILCCFDSVVIFDLFVVVRENWFCVSTARKMS